MDNDRILETEKVKICLMYRNDIGKFAALDPTSGGYPYKVEVDKAHEFAPDQAKRYIEMFPELILIRVYIKYWVRY